MLVKRILRRLRKEAWKLSMTGLERGPHITRYTMYRELAKVALPIRSGRVLSISASANLASTLGFTPTELTEATYPEVSILALPYADASYDCVLCDQVLEHIEGSPQQAVDECFRVLRPGGVVCQTTCFINPVHKGFSGDFWRFTPDGLRVLHRQFSEVLACNGWGNYGVWSLINCGLRHVPVPHATWHPYHRIAVENDPKWPIVTWIVARK